MIISQTPLRVSFAGGGSDLPAFYRKYGGAVLSTAIDKFVYVGVNKKFDDSIRISYSRTEEVATVDQIEHQLVREALRMLSIPGGIEITSIADIPRRAALGWGPRVRSRSGYCMHCTRTVRNTFPSTRWETRVAGWKSICAGIVLENRTNTQPPAEDSI